MLLGRMRAGRCWPPRTGPSPAAWPPGPAARQPRVGRVDRADRVGQDALASSALVTWDGPVVAVSVKRDLYDFTAAARAARGEIAVFDPGLSTGLASAR